MISNARLVHSPPYSSEDWQTFTHPEGKPYSVLKLNKFHVVTEAAVSRPEVKVVVGLWVAVIEAWASELGLVMHDCDELWLELEPEKCRYFFVDHSNRTVFWLNAQTSSELGLPESHSANHIKHALEAEYWQFVEQFPMHFGGVTKEAFDELFNTFLHGQADQLTSGVSTFPYSAEECATFNNILRDSRDRIADGRVTCFVARLWVFLSTYRHQTHYGEEHCRLSRDQAILVAPEAKRSLILSALSLMLFNIPEGYRKRFQDLFVDDLAYLSVWRSFVNETSDEWKTLMQWAFGLLISNLLVLPSAALPAATVSSVVLSTASVVMTVIMSQHQQGLAKWDTGEAAVYLNEHKSSYGYQPIATVYALPKGLFIWSLIAFFAQGLYMLSRYAGFPVAVVSLAFIGVFVLAVWSTLLPGSFRSSFSWPSFGVRSRGPSLPENSEV
ncbi:hypothetical protein HETIRDRAFT_325631 [Heterobasidion irregulare TC 32-1]|uniref:Uncharacterized protein n=1 Tax=Heterobasidion irregulare (strain TC 32-1) TaxID=747525 RepID=W4JXZ0_HETIT|nr:uncharacterized protein HETIRDRAFT_325631 [Heterobasidion irregulare TC 32-1]ETW77960.1 hypothetical protein HETIRDRAFT_325631 [Heterobasidion irregulare TC 32-1]